MSLCSLVTLRALVAKMLITVAVVFERICGNPSPTFTGNHPREPNAHPYAGSNASTATKEHSSKNGPHPSAGSNATTPFRNHSSKSGPHLSAGSNATAFPKTPSSIIKRIKNLRSSAPLSATICVNPFLFLSSAEISVKPNPSPAQSPGNPSSPRLFRHRKKLPLPPEPRLPAPSPTRVARTRRVVGTSLPGRIPTRVTRSPGLPLASPATSR